MNRNYKVIWNASLNCFMAVAEYAKARGKSSSGTVTSNASPTSSVVGGAKWLRLSSLCLGMAAAGFSLQAIAVAPATGAFYVGVNSTANGANYNGEGATGTNAIAIGKNASATGITTVAIGLDSGVGSTQSEGVSVGNRSGQNVLSNGNTALGVDAGSNIGSTPRTTVDGKAAYNPFTIVGQNTGIGAAAGKNVYGNSNSALGERAGREVDGHANTSVGAFSGNNVIGSANVAMGANAGVIVKGDRNTAIGNFAGAYVDGKVNSAFGNGAGSNIKGEYNLALGAGAGAGITSNLSVAIGNNAGNISKGNVGESSISVGTNSSAQGLNSIAIGRGSVSTGENATGIGVQAKADAKNSVAIGQKAKAQGISSVALGDGAEAGGVNSIVIGTGSRVTGDNSGAFGDPNIVSGTGSYAVGNNNTISNNNTFVLGNDAVTTQDNSVVLGNLSTDRAATTETGITINTIPYTYAGQGSAGKGVVSVGKVGSERQIINVAAGKVSSTSTDAINGSQLHATNQSIEDLSNTVITNKTKYYSVNSDGGSNDLNEGATGWNAMAMGQNSIATGTQAISIGSSSGGQKTTASGDQSIAIGANVVSNGASSIAIGGDDLEEASKANLNGSPALDISNSGSVNTAFKYYAGSDLVEAGNYIRNTEAGGAASIAIGTKSLSTGALSTAVGVQSTTEGVAASAFGMAASASKDGSVALGAGSTTATEATSEKTMTIGGVTYTIAGNILDGTTVKTGAQVSVGADGFERQIKNVAGGAVSATSTDAINGSQLYATNESINTVVSKKITFAGDSGTPVGRKLGETLNIKGGATNLTENNIGVVADGDGTLKVKLAKNIDLGASGSVKMGSSSSLPLNLGPVTTVDRLGLRTGNALTNTDVNGLGVFVKGPLDIVPSVALTSNGLNILNGPSVTKTGIDAGNRKITRVSNGIAPTDAVNVSQLSGSVAASRTEVKAGTNVADVVKSTGGNGQDIYTVNANGSKTSAGSPAVAVTPTTDANNLTDYAVDLSQASKDSLVKANNSVQYDNPAQTSVTLGGALATDPVSLTNVAAGNLSATSTDAVNGSQLFETNNKVDKGFGLKAADGNTVIKQLGEQVEVVGSNSNITTKVVDGKVAIDLNNKLDLGNAGSVKVGNTSVSNDGITIVAPSIARTVVLNSNGLNNGGNTITNVKAGEADNDVVNVSQLKASTNDIVDLGLNFTGDDTTVSVNRKLGQKLTIQGGATGDLTSNNLGVVADTDGNLNVKLAKDLTGLNSASFGDNVRISSTGLSAGKTLVNQNGFTFVSEVGSGKTVMLSSNGLNNGGNVITNVARGDALTDAVNVEQLNEVKQSAADANKGWDVSAQGTNTSTVKPSAKVDLNNTDGNITVSKTADSNNVSFNLNKNIAIDSVKTGDATMNSEGLTIAGGPKFTKNSIDAAGNKITNVADGVIGVNSKDAINGGQLDQVIAAIDNSTSVLAEQMDAGLNFSADRGAVINKKLGDNALSFKGGNNISTTAEGSSIKFDLNGNINVESVTTGNTTVNNSGVTIKNGPSMTAAGINAAGKKVTNVADGMAPRDAVNFGQLDAVSRSLSNNINELGYKIGEVEDDANAGISAAMAMSSIPQSNLAGRSMVGGGIASYNGESAVAVGVSRVSDNGRWVIKVNGTADTQGNAGGAIGAGFHF